MKQFFPGLFLFFFVSVHSFGQKSTVSYIHFEEEDVDKLFYMYENIRADNEEGSTVFSYTRGKQKFYFTVDNEYERSRTAPVGMNTAESAKIGETLVSAINNQSKEVMLVFRRSTSTYHIYPVLSASMMSFEGMKCVIRNQHTAFAFDTTDLNFEDNLALKKTENTVNFAVTARKGCLRQYKFTCKSQKNRQFISELEIIPSVGVVYERTGTDKTEAEENEMVLSEIGNSGFADYVAEMCNQTGDIPSDDPAPFFDPSNPPAIREYRYGDITVRISCPELLGYGKHVVQRGDNLYSISKTYGVPVRTLAKWNDIQDVNMIEVCQEIWYVPPPGEAPVGPTRDPEEVKVPGKVIDQRKLYPSDSDVQPWGSSGRTSVSGGIKTRPSSDDNDSNTQMHTVKSGETLQKLASKYNCPETCIREINNFPIKGTVSLKPGQKITIGNCDCQEEEETYGDKQPQRSTGKGGVSSSSPVFVHRVVKDKKLSTIASELGYSAQELARLNNMKESDIVRAGTELQVPRKKK